MEKTKHEAVVLRSVKYSEHDKILTLLTKDAGKMSVMAKGVQSPKSRYLASSQIYAVSEYILSSSPKGGMPYVVSAELIDGFSALSKNIVNMACAGCLTETADMFLIEKQEEGTAYRLLTYALKLLSISDESRALMVTLSCMLKFLGIYGAAPGLSLCTVCSSVQERYFFDFEHGGIVCPDCEADASWVLSADEAQYLNGLLKIDMRRLTDIVLIEDAQQFGFLKIINGYISHIFKKSLKSFAMLSSLQK